MKPIHNSRSLFAVASVLGLVACGASQTQPNAPSSAQESNADSYGSTMAQPQPSSTQNANTSTATSSAGPTGTAYGPTYGGPASSPPNNENGGSATSNTAQSDTNPTRTGPGMSPSATTGGTMTSPSQHASDGQSYRAAPSAGAGGTGSANNLGTPMDASNLDDAQIASVVETINQGEIQASQLAQTKATSADVKHLAQHMLAAHRDMEQKTRSLLTRLQIAPTDNPVTIQLKSNAQNEESTLESAAGSDFDKDYVDAQVRGHQKALDFIDRALPNVKATDFKSALQNDRAKVAEHLRDAERVQEKLQSSSH